MALFHLTWDTLPLPCGLAPGLRLIPGFQSLPELFFRHVCLQLCLPDGPWPTGRQRAGAHTADVCYNPLQTLASSPSWILNPPVALSPVPPLALSPFTPDWAPWKDPGPGSSLALSGAVDGPRHQLLSLADTTARPWWAVPGSVRALLPQGSPSAPASPSPKW